MNSATIRDVVYEHNMGKDVQTIETTLNITDTKVKEYINNHDRFLNAKIGLGVLALAGMITVIAGICIGQNHLFSSMHDVGTQVATAGGAATVLGGGAALVAWGTHRLYLSRSA